LAGISFLKPSKPLLVSLTELKQEWQWLGRKELSSFTGRMVVGKEVAFGL
jgi:hypothetical protein